MNDDRIIDRFSKYMEIKGLNDNQVTVDCGLSVGLIGKAKSGRSDIGKGTINKILTFYQDLNRTWLLTGDGEMLLPEVRHVDHPKSVEKNEEVGEVMLYDVDAAANLKTLMADKTQNILGKIQIPNIPKCDGAVYVRGDSMYPLLKTGDIVAYKEIPLDIQHIIWGEMYLISIDLDGDEYLSVKYLKHSDKGEDWIKLVSYNPHHEPKDFPLSSVRAIALVKLSIRMNTIK